MVLLGGESLTQPTSLCQSGLPALFEIRFVTADNFVGSLLMCEEDHGRHRC